MFSVAIRLRKFVFESEKRIVKKNLLLSPAQNITETEICIRQSSKIVQYFAAYKNICFRQILLLSS